MALGRALPYLLLLCDIQIVKQDLSLMLEGRTLCNILVEANKTKRSAIGAISRGGEGQGYRRSSPPSPGFQLGFK